MHISSTYRSLVSLITNNWYRYQLIKTRINPYCLFKFHFPPKPEHFNNNFKVFTFCCYDLSQSVLSLVGIHWVYTSQRHTSTVFSWKVPDVWLSSLTVPSCPLQVQTATWIQLYASLPPSLSHSTPPLTNSSTTTSPRQPTPPTSRLSSRWSWTR